MKWIKPLIITAILSFSLNSPAHSQFLPEDAEFFWMYTDDNVPHYVLEIGKNPNPKNTYIVLHGGYGGDHSYLINLVLPHTETHRFILYDQRGSLRTEAPDSTITYANFVEDLDALRRELGLESVQLLAHSNGAMIALDYLGTYPERVSHMVLMGPPLSFVHGDIFHSDELEEAISYYRTASEELSREISENIELKLKKLGLYDTEGLSGRELTQRSKIEFAGWNVVDISLWPEMQNAFFIRKVFELLNESTDHDIWNERSLRQSKALAETDIPITVIIGESDFIDPDGKVWQVLLKHAENGELITLQNSGHMPWIDLPDKMQELLNRTLQ